jgi:hypothetical protein
MTAPCPRPSPQQVRARKREVALRYSRHRAPFNHDPIRRREIERHALHIRAAEFGDFKRHLIAWGWHLPESVNRLQAVMNCASRLGREVTEREAAAVLASIAPRRWRADSLGRYLGLTYAQREAVGITTIGSVNVGKRARTVLRKHRDRKAKEAKRRAAGMRPRAEYENGSVAAVARAEGVSRMTIYRRKRAAERARNPSNVTGVSTAVFLSPTDRPVTMERKKEGIRGRGLRPRRLRRKKKKARGIRLATQADIARSYAVSQSTISRLVAPGPFEASVAAAA